MVDSAVENIPRNYFTSGYHKVICLNSEYKPWIIHIMGLLVILSTCVMGRVIINKIESTAAETDRTPCTV